MSDTTIIVDEQSGTFDAPILRIGSQAQCRCGRPNPTGEAFCEACFRAIHEGMVAGGAARDRLARYFQCPTCRPRRRAKLLGTRTNGHGEVLGKSWRCRRCGEHSEGMDP